jgi:hypothetical protein
MSRELDHLPGYKKLKVGMFDQFMNWLKGMFTDDECDYRPIKVTSWFDKHTFCTTKGDIQECANDPAILRFGDDKCVRDFARYVKKKKICDKLKSFTIPEGICDTTTTTTTTTTPPPTTNTCERKWVANGDHVHIFHTDGTQLTGEPGYPWDQANDETLAAVSAGTLSLDCKQKWIDWQTANKPCERKWVANGDHVHIFHTDGTQLTGEPGYPWDQANDETLTAVDDGSINKTCRQKWIDWQKANKTQSIMPTEPEVPYTELPTEPTEPLPPPPSLAERLRISYLGCFADQWHDRAIPNNLGVMPLEKCAGMARQNGYNLIGFQNASSVMNGECWTGYTSQPFRRHGSSTACRTIDKTNIGGDSANAVYVV